MQFDVRTIIDESEKKLIENNDMTSSDFNRLLGIKNSYVTAPKKDTSKLFVQKFEKTSTNLGFHSNGLLK